MKNTNQLWKYTWNPQGYFEQEIKIDLTKKYKNNTFTLNHTFFKSKDCKLYTYTSSGNKKFYNCHEELKDNTDFLFVNKDEDLSRLCNSSVYSRIKLISTRAINLNEVYCDCYFVADAIDPSIFNQDLHQKADVEHESLKIKECVESSSIISNSINGGWGSLNENNIIFNKKIKVGSTEISDGSMLFSEKNIKIGNKDYNIQFDSEKECCYIQVGDNRKGFLLRFPEFEEIIEGKIPIILPDDKTKIAFVEWLKLDVENEGIKLNHINIADSILLWKNNILLAKNSQNFSIKLDSQNFVEYDGEKSIVKICDNIIIDIKNNKIILGGIVLDNTFMNQFIQMQRDIQDLKNRIK